MPQHIWKLTPREAAAQCIMPRLVPNSIQESDSSKQEIMSLIAQGIGGFCVFQGDVEYTATLIDELQKSTDASTTIDAWTSRRRSYLGETIHWYDKGSLQRRNACLAIRRVRGSHTYDVLAKLIEDIHVEFLVTSKLRASTTDSGSNFCKCFPERGNHRELLYM